MQNISYILPTHWAGALINDDETGLDDKEQKQFDSFCEWMMREHGQCNAVDCGEDTWFEKYHDAYGFGVLACDCAEFTFLV